MDLITNWGGESNFNSQLGAKMNYTITVKNQLCYPCNRNLSFFKLKQVLNCKVHDRPFSYSTKEPGSSVIFMHFYTRDSIEWR